MSGLVSETMEMFYPVMERVCVVLEAAKQAQASSKEGLRQTIAKAESDLLPMLYQAVGQFDLFVDDAAKSLGADVSSSERAASVIRDIMDKESLTGFAEGAARSVPQRSEERTAPHREGDPRLVIRGSGSGRKAKSTTSPRSKK